MEDGSAGGGWVIDRASLNILEIDMILFTVFAATFLVLVKTALSAFGVLAAVLLFLLFLVSLIWSAIGGACESSATQVVRA